MSLRTVPRTRDTGSRSVGARLAGLAGPRRCRLAGLLGGRGRERERERARKRSRACSASQASPDRPTPPRHSWLAPGWLVAGCLFGAWMRSALRAPPHARPRRRISAAGAPSRRAGSFAASARSRASGSRLAGGNDEGKILGRSVGLSMRRRTWARAVQHQVGWVAITHFAEHFRTKHSEAHPHPWCVGACRQPAGPERAARACVRTSFDPSFPRPTDCVDLPVGGTSIGGSTAWSR